MGNEVTQNFKDNKDVVFGDVNLSENQVREINGEQQNPGAGGWPTVRYFNKECPKGCAYTKKTNDAMCTELGNDKYMEAYVEEAGGVSLCSEDNTESCDERSLKYLNKWLKADKDKVSKELERLNKVTSGGSMKEELKAWASARMGILKSIANKKDEL